MKEKSFEIAGRGAGRCGIVQCRAGGAVSCGARVLFSEYGNAVKSNWVRMCLLRAQNASIGQKWFLLFTKCKCVFQPLFVTSQLAVKMFVN